MKDTYYKKFTVYGSPEVLTVRAKIDPLDGKHGSATIDAVKRSSPLGMAASYDILYLHSPCKFGSTKYVKDLSDFNKIEVAVSNLKNDFEEEVKKKTRNSINARNALMNKMGFDQ